MSELEKALKSIPCNWLNLFAICFGSIDTFIIPEFCTFFLFREKKRFVFFTKFYIWYLVFGCRCVGWSSKTRLTSFWYQIAIIMSKNISTEKICVHPIQWNHNMAHRSNDANKIESHKRKKREHKTENKENK